MLEMRILLQKAESNSNGVRIGEKQPAYGLKLKIGAESCGWRNDRWNNYVVTKNIHTCIHTDLDLKIAKIKRAQ